MEGITDPAGRATSREISSQPDIWGRVLAETGATLPLLPKRGESVLFLGCGTSYYIGEAYARMRNAAGAGRTRCAIASEVPYVDHDEVIVALSRSGTTTDLVRAVKELAGSHRVIGILGEGGTPLVRHCDDVVLLDYADEESIIQTRFATAALTLLRASVGDSLEHLPSHARAALQRELPDRAPSHVVFLGSGWTFGVAHEAALKCEEASGAWTEAYAIMEYQHGPLAAADSDTLVWSMTPVPPVVAEAVRGTGATLIEPTLDPQAELVAVHRLAVQLAAIAGRDPDHPWHLSRSVELTS